MQVRNTMPTAELAAKQRVPFFSSLYRSLVEKLRGPALAITSITGIVLGGSIASVSAAEQALPGDVLYSVKLVTEQARLVFTVSAPDKVKLKSEFTKRRVEELKAIVSSDGPKKDERAGLAADVLKRDLNTLKQQLTDVQEGSEKNEAADAAKLVDQNSVEVVKALAETKEGLSQNVKDKVTDAQAQASDVGIQALEVLVAVQQDGGDSVSSEDIGSSLAVHAEVAAQTTAAAKTTIAATGIAASGTTLGAVTSTPALQLAKDAEASLATVQQLAGEQKLGEAVTQLKDATAKSLSAQKTANQEALAVSSASSSTVIVPIAGSATSTPSTASSTSANTSSTKP